MRKVISTNKVITAKQQKLLIVLCWLLYTVSYFCRYSFNANINAIMEAEHVIKSDTGIVTTCFFFAYGAGQIINGIFCKYYDKRKVLSAAMLVSVIANLLLFFGVPFAAYKFIWAVNGFAQSFLWSSIVQMYGSNIGNDRIKKAIVILSTSVATGTFLCYGVNAVMTAFGGWKYSFLISAVALLIVTVLWFIFAGQYNYYRKPEELQAENKEEGASLTRKTVILMLAAFAVFAIIDNLMKDGMLTWTPTILKEKFGYSDSISLVLTLVLPLTGILGSILVGVLKRRFNSFFAILFLLYLVAGLGIGAVLLGLHFSLVLLFLLPFAVSYIMLMGVNNLVTSFAPLYMKGSIDSGLMSGLMDGFCYVGSTVSGYGLASATEAWGWNGTFVMLAAFAGVAVILGIVVMAIESRRQKREKLLK